MQNKFLWTIVFFLIVRYSFPSQVTSCREVLEKTLASIEKIQTLKFHLKCTERVNGKLINTESQVKLNCSPRKIYIYLKGPELLWIEGENNGNALVNPDGFPFINLNLDPMGVLMRENQHHTIHEIGFEYFAEIIKHTIVSVKDKFDNYFKWNGIITWNGVDCYWITADYPDFKYIDYTVKKGESLVSIAKKLKVSDYMLLEVNSDKVRNYRDVKEGQKIKVPNAYGKKMELYIDKNQMLPRVIKVYDEKGLFEAYEYHNLQVNPKITHEEFSREYKGYGF